MAGSSVPRPHIPVRKDSNHYALQEDDGAPLHRSGKGKAPLREVAHPPPLSQPSTPISPSHPASAPASRTHSPTTAIPDRPTALPRPNPIPQPPAIGSPPPHPPAQIRPRTASRNAAATAGVFQQAYAYLHPFDTDPSPFGTSLKCQLCLEVFATPIRLPCCESLVCSTCVRRWLKTSRCCPWCGEVIEVAELRPEREVKKVVDELDCYCVNKRQGCDWVGPRKYLLIHVAEECLMTPRVLARNAASPFYFSILNETPTEEREDSAVITDLFPRTASSVPQTLPERYRGRGRQNNHNNNGDEEDNPPNDTIVPTRSTSRAREDDDGTKPRRQIPFKKAGARGSVLVPTRTQSESPSAADRRPRPAPLLTTNDNSSMSDSGSLQAVVDTYFASQPRESSITTADDSDEWESVHSSLMAELDADSVHSGVLDDLDHINLYRYVEQRRVHEREEMKGVRGVGGE